MPIFDFKCPKCKKIVEVLVRKNEKPVCKECQVVLLKLPGTFGFKIDKAC